MSNMARLSVNAEENSVKSVFMNNKESVLGEVSVFESTLSFVLSGMGRKFVRFAQSGSPYD